MKKWMLLFFCFITHNLIDAQPANLSFPPITKTGKNIRSFVPAGWKIRASIVADFNSDRLKDCAMVLERIKPFSSPSADCASDEPFYPKMLVTVFRQKNNSFILSCKATRLFGNCNWGVQGSDPFTGISLRRNTLDISFFTGGFPKIMEDYYAQFRNNDWYVTGAYRGSYHSGRLDEGTYTIDVNLITGTRESYLLNEKGKKEKYFQDTVAPPHLKLIDLDEDASTYINGD